MPVWRLSDDAIYLAVYRLEHGLNSCCNAKNGYAASGIPFINDAYPHRVPLPYPDMRLEDILGRGHTGFAYVLPGMGEGGRPDVPGDLDSDSQITLADLIMQIEMLVGSVPVDLARADLDGDGTLTLEDVRELVQLLVS